MFEDTLNTIIDLGSAKQSPKKISFYRHLLAKDDKTSTGKGMKSEGLLSIACGSKLTNPQ
jgi:hypothetical protein